MSHPDTVTPNPPDHRPTQPPDQGFMLLGLIVVIFLILLTLSVAAPIVARSLRRDREVEAVHRGNQYVRAIQLYYKKFGRYPGSIDQLEKSNNIRFLRQKYLDPINGKDDWRLIPVGQNKTTVKWFFGEPLTGLQTSGVGSIAGNLSTGIGTASMTSASSPTGAAGGAVSNTGGLSLGGASGSGVSGIGAPAGGSAAAGGTIGSSTAAGTAGASAPTDSATTANIPSGLGSLTSSSGPAGTPFMGVGLQAPGDSILVLNEQTTYATWEFLYDPRLDAMKAKALALNGGGIGSTPASSLGQTTGASGGLGASPTGTSPSGASPTSPGGTAPSPSPGGVSPPQQ
jgi:type II secretory pathway pseudopilin PulG